MKRSGAIGVVVAVLAVAALLMYFVVMPQLKGNKTVEDIANKASDTVEQAKNAVNDAGKQVGDVANGTEEAKAAVVAKMARLKADTEAAAGELQALLDKGTPTPQQVAAVKAKVEAALKAASEVKIPEGVDAATVALADKASESAKAALATLEKLSADPAAAKAAIADLKANIESALPDDAVAKPANTAKVPDAAKDSTETAKLAPDTTTTDNAKPAETTDAAKQLASPAVATFDILRVEKDGSTVIAGRAEPGAKVDIVDGDKVIASTQADDTGAFVAVLDNPLASGDHSITLKTTAKDGKSSASQEIATVSVPKDGNGQLLAMVTKPGEASKIMTMPEADKTTEVADNKGVTSEQAKDTAEQAKAAQTVDAAKTTDGAVTTPDLPALSSEIAQNPPAVATEDKAKADAQELAKADAATPADSAAKTAEKPATAPEVLVSAVEFEGDKIFIAGNARPNAVVRVYADDKIVAEVKADENGRFVADGKMPLAVGNHTIRADVLSVDGAKVEFRASVPFFRPEGDLAVVASSEPAKDKPAVEPLAKATLDTARDEAGKALGLLKDLYADGKTPTAEELAAARSSTEIALKRLSEIRVAENADAALAEMTKTVSQQAEKALSTLKALPQDPAAVKSALGSIEQGVSSVLKPATELAANTTAKEPVADPAKPADVAASKETTSTPEDGSVVSDTAQAGDVNDKNKDTQTAAEAAKDDASKDKTADAATTEVSKTADGSASSSEKQDVAGNAAADTKQDVATADQPKLIEQAPLTQDNTSVIIRRGDTLWQISRRVYGKGVRYTTIYVANQTQIADPDRIMPGQIFSMPGKWLDNAEELHKKRLGHNKK